MGIFLISGTLNGLSNGLGNHTEYVTEPELVRDAVAVENRERASIQWEGK